MTDFPEIARSAYFRVSSLALAAYEYIRMFPTAVDFYMVQWRRRRISVALVLFVLLRLSSIALTVVSNYAFFFPHFTSKSCSEFYMGPPLLKLFQIMISQFIMAVRTYNLSGRWKCMGVFLLALWSSICLLQWIVILHHRHSSFQHLVNPVVGISGSCLPATIRKGLGTWAFYGVAIVYDFIVSVICAYYLIKYKRMVTATFLSNLMDAMMYEGLLYFVGLTAINIINLVFMQSPSTVSVTAVGYGYTLVWILSQNIVLSQYRAQESHAPLVLADMLGKPQRPFIPFTPEPGPSGERRATLGDSFDRERTTTTESIQMKKLVVVEDDSNPFGVVSQERTGSSYPESLLFANPTQLPNEGEEIENQAREDESV